MFGVDLLIIVCIAVLLIEIYNETFLMNYGSFGERIRHLFSLKMIFKTIKLTSFSFLIYLLIIKLTNYQELNKSFFDENVFKFNFDKTYLYFIPVSVYSLFMILSNSIEILYIGRRIF